MVFLDIAGYVFLAGVALLLIYEILALTMGAALHLKPITNVIRPFIKAHYILSTMIGAALAGFVIWLLLHFFTQG